MKYTSSTTFLLFIMLLISGGLLSQSQDVTSLDIEQGYGAEKGFWRVYFTAPTGSTDPAEYVGGIDLELIADLENAQGTLDIAAFEWNNPRITQAVIDAHERGVQVRMVVDDEHTVEDNEIALEDGEEAPFQDIIEAGIPFVDDDRSALMHNKFMIIDRQVVWMGSMNYTINGTYRNNNNMLRLRSRRAVEAYEKEFNEMFERGEFGPRSTDDGANVFTLDGTPIEIYFASEGDVVTPLVETILSAETSIHFMTFSFTQDEVGAAVHDRGSSGVAVRGLFETRGSETQFSEMPIAYCLGLDVRQDGNPFTLHHKVFVIDRRLVVTGSFNFSDNAMSSNDENLIIIEDSELAKEYIAEFDRLWAMGRDPDPADMDCGDDRPLLPAWVDQSSTCPSAGTCSTMTCGEAYACLGEGNTRLDRDGDGVPCESTCPGG